MKRKINRLLWKLWQLFNRIRYRGLFGDKHAVTILSANCLGGVVMKTLNMSFHTPTVNLYIEMPDFVKFCLSLNKYLEYDPIEDAEESKKNGILVCRLDDIKIYCVHYKSYDEFKNAWDRRKKRMHLDNIFVIMTDRDGFSEELLPEIEKIPYEKILFSCKEYPEYKFVKCVDRFSSGKQVGSLTDFWGISGLHLYDLEYNFAKQFIKISPKKGGRV